MEFFLGEVMNQITLNSNIKSESCCPVCESSNNLLIIKISSPELLHKLLLNDILVNKCIECHHIYNELKPEDYSNILKYYEESYSLANLENDNSTTDKPGSLNEFSIKRYELTAEFLLQSCLKDVNILDIGCAEGGFLKFLSNRGFHNLSGIDTSTSYLTAAKKSSPQINFKIGVAESIPFPDAHFDVIVIDQVLEHLHHPLIALDEISRVLREDGKVIVGVPNVSWYSRVGFFPYYWYLLKEHLQHFNIATLNHLFGRKSYTLLSYREALTPMISSDVPLPNTIAVYKKEFDLLNENRLDNVERETLDIESYLVEQENHWFSIKSTLVNYLTEGKPIYCWGLSRELQYLLGTGILNSLNILEVIDSNPTKIQAAQLYNPSMRACLPHNFGEESEDAILLITAVAHSVPIENAALNLGFLGKIIKLDNQSIGFNLSKKDFD